MADRSKVVFTGTQNSHKSRLVKAFQQYENLESFTKIPDGVWGSTATINIKATVSSYNYNIALKSSELDFEFDIPFDDNLEANEGEIVVYNLSNSTIQVLTKIIAERKKTDKKESLTIEAGYEGDTGIVFKGYMTKVLTVQEGADKVTTIKVIDDIEAKENYEDSFSGEKASAILNKLLNVLKQKTNLTIAKSGNYPRDYTYESVSVDEPLESAIKKYSEVCGVSTIISKGNVYCCSLKDIDDVAVFNVSADTGLIGSPSPYTEEISAEDGSYTIEGVELDLLLQHRLSTGSVINLSSKDYRGKYYVKSGSHTFNQSESITHIVAVRG